VRKGEDTAVDTRISSAAAARAESAQLRETATELSRAARRQQHASRKVLAEATAARARARDQRRAGLPSPWSDLRWLPPDRELERVLLLVE
jgi:hypothetical protein